MKKKKIALAVAAVGLLGALAVGQTLAWFTDKDSISNNMVLNHVDIEIDEPNYNEEDYQSLIPGDPIMKDLTVTLADGSSDAWVRLKAPVVEVGDKTFPLFNEDGSSDFGAVLAEDWVKIGDYYYYTKILTNDTAVPGTSVNTIEFLAVQGETGEEYTIKVPGSWNNDYADATLVLDYDVEAVQARNITPDFTAADDPWGLGTEPVVEYTTAAE